MQFPSYVSSHDDDIFEDMISECIIIVYMDDIFIFAPDKPTLTNWKHKKVLWRLQDNDLLLKPTKCEFYRTKVKYLGMIIEEERSPWILENWKEYKTGKLLLWLNKLEDC